jgi:hypothetical protein
MSTTTLIMSRKKSYEQMGTDGEDSRAVDQET